MECFLVKKNNGQIIDAEDGQRIEISNEAITYFKPNIAEIAIQDTVEKTILFMDLVQMYSVVKDRLLSYSKDAFMTLAKGNNIKFLLTKNDLDNFDSDFNEILDCNIYVQSENLDHPIINGKNTKIFSIDETKLFLDGNEMNIKTLFEL